MKNFLRLFLCCFFLCCGLFADHDQFGLNTNNFPAEPQQYEGSPQRLYFEQLNIQWIRGGIDWKDIEKPLGQFDFTAVDKIVNYAQLNNINILFVLSATPLEYRRLGVLYFDYINPIHVDKWTAFVTAMVNRYKSVIKYWEIWNEPNCVDGNWEDKANQLVDYILIPGIAAIRAADSQAKICGPTLLSNKPGDNNHIEWLDLITQRGVVFDVLTYHQYHGGNTALGRYNALKQFHNHADTIGYAGKPFWLTETGWKVDNSEGNAVQNTQEMLNYMVANSSWWNKTFWFAYRDTNNIYPLINYQTNEPYPQYYTFKSYTNPRFVTVVSPNGGESWVRGSTYNIQWTSSNDVSDMKIELIKGTTGEAPGIVDTIISSSTPAATGSYSWTISSTQTIGSDYSIRISPTPPPIPGPKKDVYDCSDANFSINSAAPISVTVLTPNGGESWSDGSAHNITWMSTGQIANVKIEYSIDSGASYRLITNSTGNNGSYPWDVSAPFSSGCLVKISDAANPGIGDSSDAVFELFPSVPTYFTIIATAGAGGAISPAGSVQVIQGYDQTFTFPASSGYGVQSVTVDGVNQGVITSYKFSNVQTNHTITATFAPLATYTITATAGTGGTISPAGNVPVTQGTNQTFTIAANSGYAVQSVTVDGVNQGAITSYPFTNVQADHTIAATFAPLAIYTITATAGADGTISPSGSVPVTQGTSQTFTITPDLGFGIQSVTADGTDVTAWVKANSKQYPFNNVQANHTIAATFAILPTYTITPTAGTGGTINPSETVTVTQGEDQTFAITANSGFGVYSVTVDGENMGVRTSYTFHDVQTNHTIAATFAFALTPPSYTGAMFWLNAFGLESGWNTSEHPRMTADVNGDGKADIIGFFNDGVYVALATGTGFLPAQRWIANFDGDNGWWIGWHIRTKMISSANVTDSP